MKILGLQKLTLLDFPGRVAAIVFTGGCNFRCPFCQNSPLVLSPSEQPEVSREEFAQFLHRRRGVLDGVCVSGGEPTLHADLPEFLASIREAGYLVKLDTNGTNPAMLGALIKKGLVDYVAMDIKAAPERYARVCGLTDAASAPLLERVRTSADLLRSSGIDYEFRTTVVKGLHDEQDFRAIASWLAGCRRYFLQSFRDCPEVLLSDHAFSAFSEAEMRGFLSIVQKEIPQAALRGI